MPLAQNRANARQSWQAALRAKKAHWKECDAWLHAGCFPRPPKTPPAKARISVTLYLWSFMDADNCMGRVKHTVDWLVGWGYLAGDSPKHVEWTGVPEQVVDRKNPRCVITIEPLGTPADSGQE